MKPRSPNPSTFWPLLLLSLGLALGLGLSACEAAPPEVGRISAESLESDLPRDAIILDVRSEEEFAAGHVPGARNIPHGEVAARLAELGDSRSTPIVVYCKSGRRAGMASELLVEAGYSNVLELDGHMDGWLEGGHPTATKTAMP